MSEEREYYTHPKGIKSNEIREATSEEIEEFVTGERTIKILEGKIKTHEKEIEALNESIKKFNSCNTYYVEDCWPYDECVFLTHRELR